MWKQLCRDSRAQSITNMMTALENDLRQKLTLVSKYCFALHHLPWLIFCTLLFSFSSFLLFSLLWHLNAILVVTWYISFAHSLISSSAICPDFPSIFLSFFSFTSFINQSENPFFSTTSFNFALKSSLFLLLFFYSTFSFQVLLGQMQRPLVFFNDLIQLLYCFMTI